ncbi:hypothetical protein C8A01DRAFT_33304 [Parachaetomium inaequale]|uniref:GPI anchored serine-threonine rich protein n=1 Tax=Parachaetomium inaequale TaxID=2588326 RepID=A0AAN6PQA4_9PEZI|nr:hypothetical protein C8A01DRAFT_33304 [Parachaetomium inaequale]
MKAFLFPLAVLASSAMAQTTSACGADYIVESCLHFETTKLNACANDDYGCRCAQWQNIITCYNNCPNDPRQPDAEGQRVLFCGLATQYPSNTPTLAPAASTSTPAQSTGNADVNQNNPTGTGSDSRTATTAGTAATNANSAADLALNAGGVLAAVAGVIAVVL